MRSSSATYAFSVTRYAGSFVLRRMGIAPRQLVHANAAPEILYANLTVGSDNTVYLAWSNLDKTSRAQIFMRTISADGRTWSAVQQVSNARGNASRPVLALLKNQLNVAWTETDGEDSRVVLRSATVAK